MTSQLAIIGSGPCGYTAAVYAARAGLNPILFSGAEPGGQLMQTTEVENYPGFPLGILGPDMMDKFKEQAQRFNVTILPDTVEKISYINNEFCILSSSTFNSFHSVIVATGASPKWLGIPGEKEFSGFGVSACATCDGFFFKNKIVAVIGGGDTAMEEATYLAKLCKKVYMINRSNQYRASKEMLNRARNTNNIEMVEFATPYSIIGTEGIKRITHIALANNQPNVESSHYNLEVDGVFVAIGMNPNSALVKDLVDLDQSGYVKVVPGSTRTRTPGLFCAGDVADPVYRQAVVAAGMGSMAAIDAERYLGSLDSNNN